MRPTDDNELLAAYASRNSEEALAELVKRYVGLVYSSALRQVREPQLAEEVTQAVFIILAQKARALGNYVTISGWLCRVAYYVSHDTLRAERRRQHREQIAMQMQNNTSDTGWMQIAPLLDEAVAQLSETDRNAIVLRFYEQKPLRDVGCVLGVDADAAQKRVSRALEKLRKFFVKRGVSSTTALIAGAISTNSVHAAPIGLAKSVAAIAITKGAAAGSSTLTLIKGALKLMAWTKTKIAIVTGVAVLLTAGVATVGVKAVHALRPQPNIRGDWEGAVATQVGKLRVVLHISGANGSYHATVDSIDQRTKDIPISKFEYDYSSLRFESKTVDGTFDGKVDSRSGEMSGTWTQPALNTTLLLKRTATPPTIPELLTESDYAPRAGSDLQGYWKGTLQAGPTALRVAFKIAEPEDGKFVAETDSADQGASSVVVSSVTYEKPAVQLEIGAVGAVFKGTINPKGTEIAGIMTQGGAALPLTIKRADPKAEQAQAAARDADKDYSHASPNELTGHWKGALDVQGMKLHLALHVAKLPNGNLFGSLDSIDQGAKDIPAVWLSY